MSASSDPAVVEGLMREIVERTDHDYEVDHLDADQLLVDFLRVLGYGAICDLWDKVGKWYA